MRNVIMFTEVSLQLASNFGELRVVGIQLQLWRLKEGEFGMKWES